MTRIGPALVAFLILNTTSQAQVSPQPGIGDPRIQYIQYQPEQVVLIEAAVGYHVTVKLAPDEGVNNIALGDSSAWQVTTNNSGDHLFVKPLQSGVATNMTVITGERLYAFELVSGSAPGSGAYTVTFRYPPPVAAIGYEVPSEMTGRYKLSGDRALRPLTIGDDGTRTYIKWAQNGPLPAVFAINGDRPEALANGNMRDGVYVIEGISRRLVFRMDGDVARADRIAPGRD